MAKNTRKYIYISNVNYDGTVFQTQVLDWFNLYRNYDLSFDLIQAFPVKYLRRPKYIMKQLKGIRKSTGHFCGSVYLFPSNHILYTFNALIILLKILRYVFKYDEIVIFSRALIGKEITFLRGILPVRIIFYFDARAASAEENKYIAVKKREFTLKKYKTIAKIYHLEYLTLSSADKVFVVSGVLRKYFQDTYVMEGKRFVYYPCLSDSNKFYFNVKIRTETRTGLKIGDQIKVFIYSGGIGYDWHVTNKMFTFFDKLFKIEKDLLLICLTIETLRLEKILLQFPTIKPRILYFSVPNNEVYRYLNAADYGVLFRENTIMNNVASPTKFAEYMLCGLPVLISEGVGDYSDFVVKNQVGILIKEDVLQNPVTFDYFDMFGVHFDREYIADLGKKNFSKNSILESIIEEFKS